MRPNLRILASEPFREKGVISTSFVGGESLRTNPDSP
jgi:hypothetical protein